MSTYVAKRSPISATVLSSCSTILFICASHYLRYLRIKRTVTAIVNLPVTPENCHYTTL